MDEQSTGANDLLFEVQDGVGRTTFNRPQARNAFTFAMYERLAEVCEQANKDRSIKVLVFQGAGDKAFASGTDINQFRAFKTPEHAIEYESRIDRVLTTVARGSPESLFRRSTSRHSTPFRARVNAVMRPFMPMAKPPSPHTAITLRSRCTSLTAIAAGIAYPIPPTPLGCRNVPGPFV